MKKLLCRMLVLLMIWTPYQVAQAGMIGTDQVVQTASADRGAVLSFVSRADVADQLAAFGIDPATAKDRVAAMTDEEVSYLAGKISEAPAGADAAGILLLLVIIGVIWWAWKR
ncbi:MAG TPA: PA2779 family protein [Burkholderiales bacterium]|nr:PA2779 family protein [Burkholderiales bacterium]